MNFRSLSYFLTVCEMGTINAAARKLYISQQSLSQHMKKLENELQIQLFHRDNPLVLTDAGKIVKRTAQEILGTIDTMHTELARLQGRHASELTIGMLDYGMPDFIPPLIDIFLGEERSTLLNTREIRAGEAIPGDIPLFFGSRELGGGFKNEILFTDRLVVCVADKLLKSIYGSEWRLRREQLRGGDFSVLAPCPFLQLRNTPLQALSEMAFAQNHLTPKYYPVMGSASSMIHFCIEGKGALFFFLGATLSEPDMPPAYPIPNVPEAIPAGYVSYPGDTVLPEPAQRFLDITRRYFKRYRNQQLQSDTAFKICNPEQLPV